MVLLFSGKKPSMEDILYLIGQNRVTWSPLAAREPRKWVAHIFNIYHWRQAGSALKKKGEGKGRELLLEEACCIPRSLLEVRSSVGKNMSLAVEEVCFLSWLPPSAWCSVYVCGSVFRTHSFFQNPLSCWSDSGLHLYFVPEESS